MTGWFPWSFPVPFRLILFHSTYMTQSNTVLCLEPLQSAFLVLCFCVCFCFFLVNYFAQLECLEQLMPSWKPSGNRGMFLHVFLFFLLPLIGWNWYSCSELTEVSCTTHISSWLYIWFSSNNRDEFLFSNWMGAFHWNSQAHQPKATSHQLCVDGSCPVTAVLGYPAFGWFLCLSCKWLQVCEGESMQLVRG